jgi:GNAT superfamily N-acetyltransferase
MSDDITVRDACQTDLRELASLTTELGYPSSIDDIGRRLPFLLGRSDQRLLVAVDRDDRAVAWLHVVLQRSLESDVFVDVAGLVVGADHRGSGIGARLLSEAERWAVQAGARLVRVRSNVTRQRAHRFYLREGYTLSKTSYLFVKSLPWERAPKKEGGTEALPPDLPPTAQSPKP